MRGIVPPLLQYAFMAWYLPVCTDRRKRAQILGRGKLFRKAVTSVRANVTWSLCISKYHSMGTYPVLKHHAIKA